MKIKVLTIFMIFILTSCGVTETYPEVVNNQTSPNFYGVEDIEIQFEETFDELDNVSAYDKQDGYITSDIIVSGRVNIYDPGTYLLKYNVTDSDGNETVAIRYVTVLYPISEFDNLLSNGDFSFGLEGYQIYQVDNQGHGTFEVNSGVLKIDVLSIEDGIWFRPRLNTERVRFEQDHIYLIQFDAMALESKTIQVQTGELLDFDPWFTKFDGDIFVFEVTNEWTTFSYEFTMNLETNNNGNVLFEFGDVTDEQVLTTIYLDNIIVTKLY